MRADALIERKTIIKLPNSEVKYCQIQNINIYPLIESRYSSIEINGNTVWVTEIVPAPGETSGDVCGIYYSHDLGVTWHAISNVYTIISFFCDNYHGKQLFF